MARDDRIHQRLLRWADGVVVGDGSGFPTKSVLHESWNPPAPGLTPTMKLSVASDVAATHRLISRLSDRLIATIVVHYVLKPPIKEQAMLLDCAEDTVLARVERAHHEIRRMLFDGVAVFETSSK